jgi:hypothetical protein
MDEALWGVPLAQSGPEDWERVAVDDWLERQAAPTTPLDPVAVSDIWSDDDEIGFRVDEVGVPVVVRASYFPNWKVEGAEGPYRITPNLMVVVPTDEEVRLHYGYVAIDYVAWLLTFLGIAGLVLLIRRPPIVIPPGPLAEWHRRSGVATVVADSPVADALGVEEPDRSAPDPTPVEVEEPDAAPLLVDDRPDG